MQFCPKMSKSQSPSVINQYELDAVADSVHKITFKNGKAKPILDKGSVTFCLPISDSAEEGIWVDYYIQDNTELSLPPMYRLCPTTNFDLCYSPFNDTNSGHFTMLGLKKTSITFNHEASKLNLKVSELTQKAPVNSFLLGTFSGPIGAIRWSTVGISQTRKESCTI